MIIKIVAIDKYMPINKISTLELEKFAGFAQGRLEKLTGVASRHHVSKGESVCQMAAYAIKKTLNKANLAPKDIDLLIYAGASYDYPVPYNAAIIKSLITDDSSDFSCFDVDATCLSVLKAIDVAHLYLTAGRYKRILLVTSEISSGALTPDDEKTFGLFGDGAVAMVLEATDSEGYTVGHTSFCNYPSGAMLAVVPIGGAVNRGQNESIKSKGYFFKMDGKQLIRTTLKYLPEFIRNLERDICMPITSVDYIITHQTSRFGNEYFMKQYKPDPNKMINTLDIYGNCISASLALGLELLLNDSKRSLSGKKVLMMGSAAGISLGAILLNFE